eukprot:CAMPEP_0201615706 /NCGR_PEP_ID=MMETSP0492-20130828/31972_1 /ASSEMBLY_ACC=CAM_ASM_000837 /TAXON_ID=420259 /ORGANISM="Thalassiosira gravida, Strain GMp14c1" /LENGTH=353 /DNA_ID=CAMNT_0048083459 /DNA_START=120 /DNA_END=1181 /DNA_ORIENTATION=-
MTFGSGCRCSYDPNTDGGDYELLAQAKKDRGDYDNTNNDNHADAEEKDADEIRHDEESDSDSDSEFDYLLDEDIPTSNGGGGGDAPSSDYYDDLQSTRRTELENLARHAEVARHHGYGVHRQMHPQRVFPSVGYGADQVRDRACPRGAVVHLYDGTSALSVSLDLCLEEMARRYLGTKFVRGLGITSMLFAEGSDGNDEWKRKGDLPMMLAVREGRVVAWSSGLRDFYNRGSGDDNGVESKAVEQWLDHAGVLLTNPPPLEELCRIRPEEEMLLENMRKLNGLPGGGGGRGSFGGMMKFMKGERKEEEDLEEDRYECGVAGCCKSFFHEHVGVKNDAQDGLLVAESQVTASMG